MALNSGNVNVGRTNTIEQQYRDFIQKRKHPCIMAQAVFSLELYHLKVYEDINQDEYLLQLISDLGDYLKQYDFNSNDFESFIAVFPNNNFKTELEFEQKLWQVLQRLHDLDNSRWDASVSKNPTHPEFSFSLQGKAFYIMGMHPESSRLARKTPYTTIVFNLHWQFERLREMGTYQKVKKRIRQRDKNLQGSVNPVLKDFGTHSEAKQYSGRNVDANWKCPFHPKPESV